MGPQIEIAPLGDFKAQPVANEEGCVQESSPEAANEFEQRFAQSRNTLKFIAARVLGEAELAEEAVRNCFERVSGCPPGFVNDRAFGSWLLRILIDEALLILERKDGGSGRSG